jgi:hypothetical protein
MTAYLIALALVGLGRDRAVGMIFVSTGSPRERKRVGGWHSKMQTADD